MGGLPRRATFIHRDLEDGVPTLILDSGNIFSEKPPTEAGLTPTMRKARLILRAMEKMGYQAAAVGEFDLYLGEDNLTELIRSTDIRFLSANIRKADGSPAFTPSVILKAGETRVGIFGLTSRSVDESLMERRAPGLWVDDPLKTAARIVPRLREKCDLVVALTHIGYPLDRKLAETVDGIDVIIGGRTKTWLKNPRMVGRTLIASGYFQGRAIGKLSIGFGSPHSGWASGKRIDYLVKQGAGRPSIPPSAGLGAGGAGGTSGAQGGEMQAELAGLLSMTRYDGDMISLTSSYRDDRKIAGMIREYRVSLKAEVGPPGRGSRKDTGRSMFVGSDICMDCHRGRTVFWRGTDHATALESLKPRDAEADPDCIPCHVTGYMRPTGYNLAEPRDDLQGVQCEACHGMASLHAASPEIYRLIRIPKASVCRPCHTPDQDDDFDYLRDRAVVCVEGLP